MDLKLVSQAQRERSTLLLWEWIYGAPVKHSKHCLEIDLLGFHLKFSSACFCEIVLRCVD